MLRTDTAAASRVRLRDWLVAFIFALVVPPLIGFIVVSSKIALDPNPQYYSEGMYFLGVVLLFLMMFASIGILLGLFVLRFALRIGWGGWASTLCIGAGLGAIAYYLFSILYLSKTDLRGILLFVANGMISAGVIWLALKKRCPATFVPISKT